MYFLVLLAPPSLLFCISLSQFCQLTSSALSPRWILGEITEEMGGDIESRGRKEDAARYVFPTPPPHLHSFSFSLLFFLLMWSFSSIRFRPFERVGAEILALLRVRNGVPGWLFLAAGDPIALKCDPSIRPVKAKIKDNRPPRPA